MRMGRYLITLYLAITIATATMGLSAPIVMGESETATIDQGSFESILIDTNGKNLWYHVKVLSGGSVDVYMADTIQYWTGTITVYPGHEHPGVRDIEDTLKGASGLVHLVVDNGDDLGVVSTGNVTVLMEWELETDYIGLVLGVIFLIFIIIGIVASVVVKRRRVQVTTVVEDEFGRVLSYETHDEAPNQGNAFGTPSGTVPGAMAAPTEEYCPGCGRSKVFDPATRRTYCPHCG